LLLWLSKQRGLQTCITGIDFVHTCFYTDLISDVIPPLIYILVSADNFICFYATWKLGATFRLLS
jgi:hypothetical protein